MSRNSPEAAAPALGPVTSSIDSAFSQLPPFFFACWMATMRCARVSMHSASVPTLMKSIAAAIVWTSRRSRVSLSPECYDAHWLTDTRFKSLRCLTRPWLSFWWTIAKK